MGKEKGTAVQQERERYIFNLVSLSSKEADSKLEEALKSELNPENRKAFKQIKEIIAGYIKHSIENNDGFQVGHGGASYASDTGVVTFWSTIYSPSKNMQSIKLRVDRDRRTILEFLGQKINTFKELDSYVKEYLKK